MRIMLGDNNPEHALQIWQALREHGHEVDMAITDKYAAEGGVAGAYDVIVLNNNDAFDALFVINQVRQSKPDQKVIIYAYEGGLDRLPDGIESGITAVVVRNIGSTVRLAQKVNEICPAP